MVKWVLLFSAIAFETLGTSCLKKSDGFTNLWPSIGAVSFLSACFYLFSQAAKRIDLSVAYAIWCAGGIILVAMISFFFFHEPMSPMKILFLSLILIGSVGLQFV